MGELCDAAHDRERQFDQHEGNHGRAATINLADTPAVSTGRGSMMSRTVTQAGQVFRWLTTPHRRPGNRGCQPNRDRNQHHETKDGFLAFPIATLT